jgi:hypothetical protein
VSDPTLAERAFTNMVTTSAAPPSFDGQGWLVALNLFAMTAGFCLTMMLAGKIVRDMWRNRYRDKFREPVTILRMAFLAFSCAGALRFGGEAAVLWGWNPSDPTATAAATLAKRLIDPIAAPLGWCGFALFVLAERGIIDQLRKQPFPINMWASLEQLKRPAIVVLLCFVAAIGVVSTR